MKNKIREFLNKKRKWYQDAEVNPQDWTDKI